MSTSVESTSQPFNLDAILQEFSVTKVPEVSTVKNDDLAITRVRESLGLGRSLFRRKEVQIPEEDEADQDTETVNEIGGPGDDTAEKSVKPRKRIIASDDEDEDEDDVITHRPTAPRSSPAPSTSPYNTDNDDANHGGNDTPGSPMSDDDDLLTGDALIADFRKARLEALSAKVAAKNRPEKEDIELAVSERSESPIRSPSRSPSTSGRKAKTRKASKKALDEMHRETQRMARNMGLRPEVKVGKKIEMSSIFAKFGFKPQGDKNEETATNLEQPPASDINEATPLEIPPTILPTAATAQTSTAATARPSLPVRYATPNLYDSDSDDSLPSPTKIETFLPTKPAATKAPTPKRVQFTLPPSPNSSDSDSDFEILPPQSLLSTTAATPDRQRTRRTALIRSLANVKSPGRQARSPGKMTQKELDMTLSMEAAVQAARKREERRAELKSLGIDTERIVEKRDLLEEAREEARRVREDEGGEDSDEEYAGDEENDTDADGESGDESDDHEEESANESGEEMEVDDESGDEMDEDVTMEDAPQPKRKPRVVQITSDDEDEGTVSQSIIPESTAGSEPKPRPMADFAPADDVSLTQFFNATQMSGYTENTPSKTPVRAEGSGTGLTQFFTSTALDEESTPLGENAAHSRMDLLRQQAGRGIADLGDEAIGFPGVTSNSPETRVEPSLSSIVPASDVSESPVQRRILKRRRISEKPSKVVLDETSEEFIKSRKEFIEEQAEESEDDYAAWASGDESDNENMNGVVDGLIDDETKINKRLTERQVAQLYMEGELERDEKEVHGLMRDIQNGGLRRRRGGGLEMGDWDSDDDDDDADERRRRWEIRREEMKRRMLEDENLGKLAANPKTQAFLNAISSTTLNFDDEPDFFGDDVIDDRRAGTAARNLPNSVPVGDSQSQSQSYDQSTETSTEIQVPATYSGNFPRHERDRLIIDELTQIEDSQPMIPEDLSLSDATDSEDEDEPAQPFAMDKVYTGFIDRAAQKRASRTASETTTRFAFKAVAAASPAKAKRAAVSVIEADDEPSRKKIMKDVIGSKTGKRKAWGSTRGRGAVTFRGSGGRGKENIGGEIKRKGDGEAERRRRDMLMLMDSQNSFC